MTSKSEAQPVEPAQGPDLSHVLAATRAPDHPQAAPAPVPGGQVQPASIPVAGYRLTPDPEPPSSPTDVLCPNPECGVRLVAVLPGGERELQVFERHIRRPHLLTPDELPLAWTCHQCGTPLTIA